MTLKYGLLFGLNYQHEPSATLRGCVNDVNNMSEYLRNLNFTHVDVYTDESDYTKTTANGIIQEIEQLAKLTNEQFIDIVWIHFSGHGCSVRDWSGDESDGKDECIVPSDFKTAGVVRDDKIKNTLQKFNKNTKVILFFDCCHSGTIGDLKYKYLNINTNNDVTKIDSHTQCEANTILISGCKDNQTSADAFNVMNQRTFTGAMTSCLLNVLQLGETKLFNILNQLKVELSNKRFTQIPQLSSSYELKDDELLL